MQCTSQWEFENQKIMGKILSIINFSWIPTQALKTDEGLFYKTNLWKKMHNTVHIKLLTSWNNNDKKQQC